MSEQTIIVKIALKGPADTKIKLQPSTLENALSHYFNLPNYHPFELNPNYHPFEISIEESKPNWESFTQYVKSLSCEECDLPTCDICEIIDKRFRCEECNIEFQSARGLKAHLLNAAQHNIKECKCDKCGKPFHNLKSMNRHKKTCEGVIPQLIKDGLIEEVKEDE